MLRLRTLIATTAITALAAVGSLPTGAHAATATADPFASVRQSSGLRSNFVGTVDRAPLGIQISTTGDAVAYWCDGTGKLGIWFTGKHTGTAATVQLKAADGSTIDFDTKKRSGTVTRFGKRTAFTLAVAQANAGIYRDTITDGAGRAVAGWVLTNDGYLSGQVTIDGKVAAFVAETPTAPQPVLPTATPLPAGTNPVPLALQGFGCGARRIRAIWTEIRIIAPSTQKANELWDDLVADGCVQAPTT